ncbi:molybdate transport system permease protein [Methylohalomonas lacus]|uniref:Molybdenum transport system permease n=1 Tax=Methylohalomonas lacus TaxID=398773 RepID=A0AAE3HL28_9GAMM|nr:molybdate ABC transporter permease subunit [Methylohalomonas lacus]MCS3904311.1 molybdate transport system permease protein [Methylohalomonas lacus]
MDWTALNISLQLAAWASALLLPIGLLLGRWLAATPMRGRGFVEAAVALPLVLPPTVLGFYLLVLFSDDNPAGWLWRTLTGSGLNFSFSGIVIASVIFNLPFAVQPIQRAFESIPPYVREAAWCSGLSHWRTFWRIELPLIWPGVISAMILTFIHTLGEFGVILMVGGAIDGETRTIAIAIYDRMQAFDESAAATMSLTLLIASFAAIGIVYSLTGRKPLHVR